MRSSSTFVAMALALAACSSPPIELPTTAAARTMSTELDWSSLPIGPQDVIKVGVYGHPELGTAGTRIDMEGNLSLPLVGPVQVSGMSVSKSREAVTAAYAAYIVDPKVDVSVVEHFARRFYVFGEVNRPGALELDRPLTVLQGLALAGGFSNKADRSQVVLLRGSPENLEVEVIDGNRPEANAFLALHADDFVFVRRSNAGQFTDEVLPYLSGISASLSSLATVLLIEDRLKQ